MKRILGLLELSVRMLFDTPLKSLGTLVGVIVSVFLMAQQLSLLIGILGRVAAFANNTDAEIWLASPATESLDATDSMPARRVGEALGTRGVAWASPIVQGFGRVTRPDGVREQVKVMGVEAPRYAFAVHLKSRDRAEWGGAFTTRALIEGLLAVEEERKRKQGPW